jgi:hypothetical protein
LFSPRPVWRYAAVGAAGIVIGIMGHHLMKDTNGVSESVDIKHLYGSIAPGGDELPGSSVKIDVPGARGLVTFRKDDKSVLSRLVVDSGEEIEIVLEYEGSPIEFAAGDLSRHPSNQVAIEGREVHVRNRGKGTYHILFSLHDDPEAPVKVRVLSGGSVLFEKEISPTRIPVRG